MQTRIAIVADHAIPSSAWYRRSNRGPDAYLVRLVRHLICNGYAVDMLARKSQNTLPEVADQGPNLRVLYLRAGPAKPLTLEECLEHTDEFTTNIANLIRREKRYDLTHANCWVTGVVSAHLKSIFEIPFVVTLVDVAGMVECHKTHSVPEYRTKIEEWLVHTANAVVLSDPIDLSNLIRLYNADPKKLCIAWGNPDGYASQYPALTTTAQLPSPISRPFTKHIAF